VTLPIGFDQGMPVGGNVMGRAFDEATTLHVAHVIENGLGFFNLSTQTRKPL
jgi:Asp-tRNA(Asn)/Glu-tRNA(Gln) amidotransferase A subunit family amidase